MFSNIDFSIDELLTIQSNSNKQVLKLIADKLAQNLEKEASDFLNLCDNFPSKTSISELYDNLNNLKMQASFLREQFYSTSKLRKIHNKINTEYTSKFMELCRFHLNICIGNLYTYYNFDDIELTNFTKYVDCIDLCDDITFLFKIIPEEMDDKIEIMDIIKHCLLERAKNNFESLKKGSLAPENMKEIVHTVERFKLFNYNDIDSELPDIITKQTNR